MNSNATALNIGIVLLSQDFHVIGINDYARDIYGPVLKELGNSVYRCHSQKSRERVSVLLRELTAAPADMPRTVVIEYGKPSLLQGVCYD